MLLLNGRPDWQTTGTERLNKASSSMQESILNHGQNGHGEQQKRQCATHARHDTFGRPVCN
eukprot:4711876-Amphidinium_carterae.1